MTRAVVHFTDTSGFGGAEKMLLAMLEGTDRQRWTPILTHYSNAAAMELGEAARRLGVETRIVPESRAAGGAAEIVALARLLHAERAAIFHAHLVWTLRCSKGLLAARLAGVPGIVATQQLYGLPKGRRRRLRQWLVSTLPHRYLSVSEAMAADLRTVVARPDRVVVVPNAIDAPRFRSATGALRSGFASRPGGALVLTLARLDSQKGIAHLITAARQIPDASILIAGDGPDRERLQGQAIADGVADRVVFLGHRTDVPELLAACDVFVLPSLFEGLPVSVLEAMAAGKPVVATRIPGTDEAVVNGETGILVPPSDPVALGAALSTLLDDPALRVRMGSAGRQRVAERFSIDALRRAVSSVYGEVLDSTRPRPPSVPASAGRRRADG